MIYEDPFTFINSITYKTGANHISNLIDLSFKHAYNEYLNQVFIQHLYMNYLNTK